MLPFDLSKEIVDQCEKLKYLIFDNNLKKNKIISIVSSTDGEGTSTIAINFAISLAADRQSTILLIDGNLRRPILHKIFNVEKENGLTDILLNSIDFQDALKKTAIPNLLLITSGGAISDHEQFYELGKLEEVLTSLAKRLDCILLDCPPINPYPESTSLVSKSDGAILVVQAGKVRREVVRHAKEQLTKTHVDIFGIVLNRRRYYIPKFFYDKL